MKRSLLISCLLLPLVALAGDEPRDRATLKGVTSLGVVIDVLPPDLLKEGVTGESLQAHLTQLLRDAGLPLDTSAKEFAGLRMTCIRDGKGPFAVTIVLGFYQPAVLARDQNVRLAPETWQATDMFIAAPRMLERGVTDSVDALAARLIAAWRSVNPR